MSDQTEATRQADWILPPIIDTTGLLQATPNAVQLAVTTSVVIADLASIPCPSYFDPELQANDPNPLGHYICMQARGGDVFVDFGSSFASMTATNVSAAVVTAGGSGYAGAAPPTVAFSGGGASVQATGHVVVGPDGQVKQVVVDTPGTGYTSAPAIAFSGGAGSGAAATAVLGSPPNPAMTNTVNATTGVITMAAGASLWIPAGSTATMKLPAGRTGKGKGQQSSCRFLGAVTSSGSATLHVWQSSP
jgi:hypothetical protein